MGIFRDVASAFVPGMAADKPKRSSSQGSADAGDQDQGDAAGGSGFGENFGKRTVNTVEQGAKRFARRFVNKRS